jgi:hypothetical protein
VSVLGGIQPGTLARALIAEYREAGLGARILMAMPQRRTKKWTDLDIDSDTLQAYGELIDKLATLAGDTDNDGMRVPFAVKLSPAARQLWIDFYNEWAEVQSAAEGELASCFSKLEAYAIRLALLHSVVSKVGDRVDDCDPIEVESIQAGITLARWFAAEAVRIYGAMAESKEQKELRTLYEFILSRGGETTTRELQRSNPTRYPRSEQAEAALESLVEAGMGAWVPPPPPRGVDSPPAFCVCSPTRHLTELTEPPQGTLASTENTRHNYLTELTRHRVFPRKTGVLSVLSTVGLTRKVIRRPGVRKGLCQASRRFCQRERKRTTWEKTPSENYPPRRKDLSVSHKHEALGVEIDRLAAVLSRLKARSDDGDGIDLLSEAKMLLTLDLAARKLSRLSEPTKAAGKKRR